MRERKPKKTYTSHKTAGISRSQIYQVLKSEHTTDRFIMNKLLRSLIQFLDENGIIEYQNFIRLFQGIGFKSKDFINFINFMKENKKEDILEMTKREITKANKGEKNVFLNWFACKFPIYFSQYSQIYIKENFPQIKNPETFFKELQSTINQLSCQEEKNMILYLDSDSGQYFDDPFEDDIFDPIF